MADSKLKPLPRETLNEEVPVPMLFPGLAQLLSTERRSSVDVNLKDNAIDEYGRSDPASVYGKSPRKKSPKSSVDFSMEQSKIDVSAIKIPDIRIPELAAEKPAKPEMEFNNFGNFEIDLDNLGAILGSTSITISKPNSEPANSGMSTILKIESSSESNYSTVMPGNSEPKTESLKISEHSDYR